MELTTSYSPRLAALFDPEIPRDRLLIALGEVIMEKGFANTVVADIVKRARVSRRTFYEEFADRAECFLELCDRATAVASDVIEAAADPQLTWEEQTERAVDAYFAFMSADVKLTRSMLFEIYGLGERGMAAHRRTHRRFTEQLHRLAERAREADPQMHPIDYATASAVVAAIYELIMLISEEPQLVTLDEARATAVRLVLSVGHSG
jgi:AcrR family transcriptional regulator